MKTKVLTISNQKNATTMTTKTANIFRGNAEVAMKDSMIYTKDVNLSDGLYSNMIRVNDETEFKMPVFSVITRITDITGFIAAANELKKFVGKDDLRPIFSYIHYNAQSKQVEATDAHRLKFISFDIDTETNFLFSPEILPILQGAKKIELGSNETHTFIIVDNDIIIENQILQFPNVRKIFPQNTEDHTHKFVLPKETVSKAIKDLDTFIKAHGGKSYNYNAELYINGKMIVENKDYNYYAEYEIKYSNEAPKSNVCGLIMPVMICV